MKRYILVSLFLLLSLYGTSQQSKSLILSAYQSNSKDKIDKFFVDWERETLAFMRKDSLELNDTLTNLKNVFRCVYDSISSSPENTRNSGAYFVVQSQIAYEFTDTTNKDYFLNNTFLYTADGQLNYLPNNKVYQLKYFIPKIEIGSKQWLLLEQKYDSLLGSFLGNKKHFSYYKGQDVGTTPLSVIIKSKNESEKRLNFISKYMQLPDNDNFTNKWNLCSNPYISRIIFTNGFSKAWIDIDFGVTGGVAFLENSSSGWVLKEIVRTWIQ
ncbi:MAG: hypothetical protein IPO01_14870 [Chitinophagaceae bacterium]|nr:hypothetical protein [Chitinophagaceae bacterium]MBP8113924.1 hypothetical protein [Chitinophagaceae bacterium]